MVVAVLREVIMCRWWKWAQHNSDINLYWCLDFRRQALMQLGASLHIPNAAAIGVTIKFSFQIVLPTMHRRWVVMDNLGDPLQGSRDASLARKRQGSMRGFGTIKLSLMQETVFVQPLPLQVRKRSHSPSAKEWRAEAGR